MLEFKFFNKVHQIYDVYKMLMQNAGNSVTRNTLETSGLKYMNFTHTNYIRQIQDKKAPNYLFTMFHCTYHIITLPTNNHFKL